MENQNYYELLGIEPESNPQKVKEIINSRIRKLQASVNSPYKKNREAAENEMKVLIEARKILLDPVKRKQYNQEISITARVKREDEKTNLRIAATKPGYDDIGSILKRLDYDYTVVRDSEILDFSFLKKYNLLFINCRRGGDLDKSEKSLNEFVNRGGILYASCLVLPHVCTAFPSFIDYYPHLNCVYEKVNARVLDHDLQLIIGSKIEIFFDSADCYPILKTSYDTRIYLIGSFKTGDRPVLVSFKYGEGEVIFTSFHNHKQISELEEKILKFLVLKSISAASKIPVIKLAQSKGLVKIQS